MSLTKHQNKVFEEFKLFLNGNENEMVITGPGGVGKSHVLQFMINHVLELGMKPCVVCPTNKSLEVVRKNDDIDYMTVASFFQKTPRYNSKGELSFSFPSKMVTRDYDILFIDECSMIEINDYDHFTKLNVKKVYLGDNCQLPPVGEKSSIVFDKVSNLQKLSKIIRSNNDDIKKINKSIRKILTHGKTPVLETNDNVRFLNNNEFNTFIEKEFDDESIILSYTNKSVQNYNSMIRKKRYPDSKDMFNIGEKIVFKEHHNSFYSNQECIISDCIIEKKKHSNGYFYKVYVLTINDQIIYRVHEDDETRYIGLFSQIYKENKKRNCKNWEKFYQSKSEFLPPIEYGYAITCHKSQGSTFKKVFIDLQNIEQVANNFDVDFNRVMYTGISRASDKLYVLYNL